MQRVFLVLGGPLDDKAFRITNGAGRPRIGSEVDLWCAALDVGIVGPEEEFLYVVRKVPRTHEPLMLPAYVLVHHSVPNDEIVWRTFLSTIKAFASQVIQ